MIMMVIAINDVSYLSHMLSFQIFIFNSTSSSAANNLFSFSKSDVKDVLLSLFDLRFVLMIYIF